LSPGVQPDTGQQHQLRKIATRILQLAAAMIVVVLLSELFLFVANLHARRRAEKLLSAMRALKVGLSTIQDVQPILSAYKADKIPLSSSCPLGDVAYGLRVSNDAINSFAENHPALLKMGVTPWGTSAVLSFRGGRLCDFHYSTSALLLESQYPLRRSGLAATKLVELRQLNEHMRTCADCRGRMADYGQILGEAFLEASVQGESATSPPGMLDRSIARAVPGLMSSVNLSFSPK
jgi:hypothetical protein